MLRSAFTGEEMGYRRLTLREALASDRLEDFVRQEEARGIELANGSDLELAFALLITQRRLEDRSFTAALEKSSARRSRRRKRGPHSGVKRTPAAHGLHVCFGSLADNSAGSRDVRFNPEADTLQSWD